MLSYWGLYKGSLDAAQLRQVQMTVWQKHRGGRSTTWEEEKWTRGEAANDAPQ